MSEKNPLIVMDWPPNIWQIRNYLPVTRKNIFAYDGVIYSPDSDKLPIWLIEHERIHFAQQNAFPGGASCWWDEFLTRPKFRLMQEIPAHQREWQVWLSTGLRSRTHRRVTLKNMAGRLAGAMYGKVISVKDAKREIAAG